MSSEPATSAATGLKITSPRLTIRTAVPSDGEALVAYFSDHANFPWPVEEDLTLEKMLPRVDKWAEATAKGSSAFMVITLRETDQLIGFGGFNSLPRTEPLSDQPPWKIRKGSREGTVLAADVGVSIDHHYQRKGYAREAVCAVVEHGFEKFGCAYAHLDTQKSNEPMKALMSGLGIEGVEGDDSEPLEDTAFSFASKAINYNVDRETWISVREELEKKGAWPFPSQLSFGDASLGDLLWTKKGRCLFHADAGHGQVCGPLCSPGVFHAEKDHHSNLELRETREIGIGVFTKQAIPKGTVLGLYSGALRLYDQLSPAQKRYSNFLFKHPQHGELYLDASAGGNWTRFLNHSCGPNCSFARALRCGHTRVIYVRARRQIQAGEQLFVDYGRDYFQSLECKCRSKDCRSATSRGKRKRVDEFEYERLFSDEYRETGRAANPRREGLRAKVKVRKLT
ncbi:hypothetical protein INS49_015815 [Diaporthe citri]|uniref:uncharacterized protein n=1 Tax=Diaporthe citri TaxID=83186 RepID=UPI001C8043E3|nr:uncharacterized protein INS49_015815 [Diaporthe citri]KAG6356427.1 hypothetical protein INS49_015815 [Diaporthe citri]